MSEWIPIAYAAEILGVTEDGFYQAGRKDRARSYFGLRWVNAGKGKVRPRYRFYRPQIEFAAEVQKRSGLSVRDACRVAADFYGELNGVCSCGADQRTDG